MTSDNDRRRGLLARLRERPAARSRGRRRLGAAVRLIAALMLAGGAYTVFAPGAQAQDNPQLTGAAAEGKALFDVSCVTCHGRNAQGVEGRGPSLIGVGAASVEFQVSSGRMPLARQEAQAHRKPPVFNDEQTRQLAQYIQELGGGPVVPEGDDLREDGNIAAGGELFRINCSQCHAFGGGGGALSSGKFAPSLHPATDRQIYAAMLSGPQNMPVFGDNQLRPEQKADIIAYIQETLKHDQDPGGFNLGRYGPSTEGLAIFLVGIVALVFASLWIAGKS
ncbi:cytochrome c [Micromonospora noduli]|uniref:Cytochrome bc1 complex cytochrome c subunit n=1 Tax=Micromonospora noduli TaxID=709876 RepID=A0A328NFE0_9ACTN|nr:cytochrome c [Micromonospora noduli]KAB1921329.1 c-type cytochrome [Micromonospora noduli]RAO05228.1 Ubiquinol-cytochrome c reductase cytochrome c su bunit [Micromonospora noduli]RAO07499.1 Ubiquinol-cytochrome c reductase cytochrome c su bunit [Micromonospora noduli]RAO20378.1 Ubiquinol-cytochrome c reductase cytochrome c su bunit [Micromonospora noduli]RAO21690.1 Ubiquinol-cytochrome c reductase cytochrome c su bunit [Micromonospora noduli]